uniref:Secreted protein n=1 Tax=Labrus bergylta TaxID=56723 RepID=A0A3Q3LLL2_9LABR
MRTSCVSNVLLLFVSRFVTRVSVLYLSSPLHDVIIEAPPSVSILRASVYTTPGCLNLQHSPRTSEAFISTL